MTIFHLLHKGNKLKLPEVWRPDKVGHTNDPNYCLFSRMVHHPTSKCFILKDKIQALVDAEILTLKSEQKKVTTNMVTLNFETFPKVTIQDGVVPAAKARMEVINLLAKEQEAKGLVPLTTKSGKSVGVPRHCQRWAMGIKPTKLKEKSCNAISLEVDDDIATVTSLSSSEEKKFTFTAQPATL